MGDSYRDYVRHRKNPRPGAGQAGREAATRAKAKAISEARRRQKAGQARLDDYKKAADLG